MPPAREVVVVHAPAIVDFGAGLMLYERGSTVLLRRCTRGGHQAGGGDIIAAEDGMARGRGGRDLLDAREVVEALEVDGVRHAAVEWRLPASAQRSQLVPCYNSFGSNSNQINGQIETICRALPSKLIYCLFYVSIILSGLCSISWGAYR